MRSSGRRHALVAILIAFLGLSAATVAAQCFQASGWSPGVSMPQARSSIDAAKDHLGRIYIAGGDPGPQSTVMRYDEASGTWSFVAPMSTARSSAGVASDAYGRIYVFGGLGNGGQLSGSAERYDPSSNTWQAIAPMPQPAFCCKAVASSDGFNIFVLGGSTSAGTSTNAVRRYDVATGQWTTETPMLRPRVYFGAALGTDGHIYAIGGTQWNAGSSTDGTVERRDPATGQWSMVAQLVAHPHQVGDAVADTNGLIYAIAGWNGTFGPLSAAVERYDPAANTWQTCTPLPQATNNIAAVLAPSGRIYVFGGDGPSSAVRYAPPTSSGPISIAGRTMIKGTSLPVSNAVIEVRQNGATIATTSSNGAGYYQINLPSAALPGTYSIRATITFSPQGGYSHPPVINYRYPNAQQSPALDPDGDMITLNSGSNVGLDVLFPQPVILVHGILSDPSSWTDFETMLRLDPAAKSSTYGRADRGYIAFSLGYDALGTPNAHLNQDFDTSASILSTAIASVRTTVSAHYPLTAPIDIIAHSMGGLVSRAYLHNNAAQGSVDRVFTLGTPHVGCFYLVNYNLMPFIPVAVRHLDPTYIVNSFEQSYYNMHGARFVLIGCSVDFSSEPELFFSAFNHTVLPQDDGLVSTLSSVDYPFYFSPGMVVLATHTVPDFHTSLNDNSPPGGPAGTLYWVLDALEQLN